MSAEDDKDELLDMAQHLLEQLQAYEAAGGNAEKDLPEDYKLLIDTLDMIDEINRARRL